VAARCSSACQQRVAKIGKFCILLPARCRELSGALCLTKGHQGCWKAGNPLLSTSSCSQLQLLAGWKHGTCTRSACHAGRRHCAHLVGLQAGAQARLSGLGLRGAAGLAQHVDMHASCAQRAQCAAPQVRQRVLYAHHHPGNRQSKSECEHACAQGPRLQAAGHGVHSTGACCRASLHFKSMSVPCTPTHACQPLKGRRVSTHMRWAVERRSSTC
jgi:hypothetical protein